MTSLSTQYDSLTFDSGYTRPRLTNGIVHIGVGGFHRAHQAWYLEHYHRTTGDSTWGITGIGLLPADREFLSRLQNQDGLYTLTLVDDAERRTDIIGAITGVIAAADEPDRAIAAMADPSTRIISMTVTEGGYLYDFETDQFMADHPLVKHDLATQDTPKSLFGYLVRALRRRMDTGTGPVTLMTCDNVPGNGRVLGDSLRAYVTLSGDTALLDWMADNVSFPNSMVDRITPTPSESLSADVKKHSGLVDQCPVLAETFGQWVIEDDFIAGRPDWEQVGVQVTDEVEAYENLKLRILNGTHATIAMVGRLHGLTYIHETLDNPVINRLARHFMDREAQPGIEQFSENAINAYKHQILTRFANPGIADGVDRVASDGYSKIKNYLMPILRQCLARGEQPIAIALAIAGYLHHLTDTQNRWPINEPQLTDDARQTLAGNAEAFLYSPSFFGDTQQPEERAFVDCVSRYLEALKHQPVLALVEHALADNGRR